jgi:hypothetical protein
MRSFYINLIVETNILNEYLIIKDVARAPRGVDGDFCLLVGSFGSRHLIFGLESLGNPSVLVFVRDSRVRDWL